MGYKDTLKILGSLVAPLETSLSPKDNLSPAEWFETLLRSKLVSINKEADVKNADIRWCYAEFCLKQLCILHTETMDINDENDLLFGVNDQKIISSVLQLIVGMGIVPYLIPGVGLPIEKRSKFVEVFIDPRSNDILDDEKRKRIVHVVRTILSLTSGGAKQLSVLIVTKNFGDILAALIQLSYAPLRKPDDTKTVDGNGFVMTKEIYEILRSEQDSFLNDLKTFIDRVYQPLVVKYLLVIQSGGGEKRVPKWLTKSCGELLSDRLIQRDGVLNVIRGVLDIGISTTNSNNNSNESLSDIRKFQVIASVLSNPPSTFSYSNIEEYYRLLCPQIITILRSKDNETYRLVASACIRSITERSLILSRRYLLEELMDPLLRLSTTSEEGTTENDLDRCITDLHFVFVVGNDPSVMFVNHLEPIIRILFELHCSIVFGVSHLRSKVNDLLVRFLKFSTLSYSLDVIRSCAFHDGSSRMKTIHPNIRFVPGDGGGTKAVVVVVNGGINEETNFYVADDEKSIAIVDLAAEVSREMTLELFMSLIKDLTEIMSENRTDCGSPNEEEKFSANTTQKLLELERDIEDTMLKLRKNLMVIRLLGLLSEDDHLQDDLSENSSRMIGFITATVERGAALTENRRRKSSRNNIDDDDDGNETGLMEVQSLAMALSILSVHLTQPDVKPDDWRCLQKSLTSFKILEDHYDDERIRSISKKLRTLIATHGIVLENSSEMRKHVKEITNVTERMQNVVESMKRLSRDEESKRTPYASAIFDLTDPLIPVRGHGIIKLTNLIESKDEETLQNLDHVYRLFCECLEDEDSYVYLSSIKGLVTLITRHSDPETVLSSLLDEFRKDRKCFEKSMEIKTKVGEALVKITILMGEMTPKYKNRLLNSFLSQVNQSDELVRASVLANLGEVCQNLKFSLGNVVEEIFLLLDNVIKLDKSIVVRRAAISVIEKLLDGLGQNTFVVLKDVLKNLYGTLKSLERNEKDEVMIHHVQTAIETINKIVKDFFTPESDMRKTIYVLDAPPDGTF